MQRGIQTKILTVGILSRMWIRMRDHNRSVSINASPENADIPLHLTAATRVLSHDSAKLGGKPCNLEQAHQNLLHNNMCSSNLISHKVLPLLSGALMYCSRSAFAIGLKSFFRAFTSPPLLALIREAINFSSSCFVGGFLSGAGIFAVVPVSTCNTCRTLQKFTSRRSSR